MAIDDEAKTENKFRLHNGPLTDFYPKDEDRAQFDFLGRAQVNALNRFWYRGEESALDALASATAFAETRLKLEASKVGGAYAFNTQFSHTLCIIPGMNDVISVSMSADIYRRNLK